jgi:hypothetical protein
MATNDTGRLHKLLRGEIAAVQSYKQALADMRAGYDNGMLADFLDDHRHAVEVLSRHIERLGEEPDRSAGPWGAFAHAIETAASWLDDVHVLKAIKEGEVHGRDEYRTALGLDSVPPALRQVVEGELLPRQEEHIRELDVLIARIEGPPAHESLPERIQRKLAR